MEGLWGHGFDDRVEWMGVQCSGKPIVRKWGLTIAIVPGLVVATSLRSGHTVKSGFYDRTSLLAKPKYHPRDSRNGHGSTFSIDSDIQVYDRRR